MGTPPPSKPCLTESCPLTADQLEAFIKLCVHETLDHLGLADPDAPQAIKDMRSLINGFNEAKREIWRRFLSVSATAICLLILSAIIDRKEVLSFLSLSK